MIIISVMATTVEALTAAAASASGPRVDALVNTHRRIHPSSDRCYCLSSWGVYFLSSWVVRWSLMRDFIATKVTHRSFDVLHVIDALSCAGRQAGRQTTGATDV